MVPRSRMDMKENGLRLEINPHRWFFNWIGEQGNPGMLAIVRLVTEAKDKRVAGVGALRNRE